MYSESKSPGMLRPLHSKYRPEGPSANDIIAEARASLLKPRRPFTPAEKGRQLIPPEKQAFRRKVILCRPNSSMSTSNLDVEPSNSSIRNNEKQVEAVSTPTTLCPNESTKNTELHRLLSLLQESTDPEIELSQLHELILQESGAALPVAKIEEALIPFLQQQQEVDRVLLACCSLIEISGKNGHRLVTIYKCLFKFSKHDANDKMFTKSRIIETCIKSLKELITLEEWKYLHEILLYSLGTLKNISMNEDNQSILFQHGGLQLLEEILNLVCKNLGKLNNVGYIYQWLLQVTKTFFILALIKSRQMLTYLLKLTGLLRNMALSKRNQAHFSNTSILENLFPLFNVDHGFTVFPELMLNISRLMSKISRPELLQRVGKLVCSHAQSIAYLLQEYQDFEVDVLFANQLSKASTVFLILCKALYFHDCLHPYLSVIMELSVLHGQKLCDNIRKYHIPDDDDDDDENGLSSKEYEKKEEIVIKIVRIIANLAIESRCGESLCEMSKTSTLVDMALSTSNSLMREELILNIVGALNNLSYYTNRENNQVCLRRLEIVPMLVPLLLSENKEIVIESCRVLGNLSQFHDVRKLLGRNRGREILIVLLDHSDRNIVYFSCGVLMNLTADSKHCKALYFEHGIDRLVDCLLIGLSNQDWELIAVVTKTLHNYRVGMAPEGENFLNHFSDTQLALLQEKTGLLKDHPSVPENIRSLCSALNYLLDH